MNTMQFAHFCAKREKATGTRLTYRMLLVRALRNAYRILKRGGSLETEVSAMKKVDRRIEGEVSVIRAVVRTAIKAGCTVSVYDGEEWAIKQSSVEGDIMKNIYSTDCEALRIRKDGEVIGTVSAVYGNSAGEVLSDWTDTEQMNNLLAPAMRRMDRYAAMGI